MIDIQRENILTLAQASKRIPGRTGPSLSVSTIHRWVLNGVGGTYLETIMVGGRKMTSVEAIQRFCDARTRSKGSPERDPVSRGGARRPPVAAEDQKMTDQALIRAGILRTPT